MDDLFIILRGCHTKEHKYQKILYVHYYGFALKTVFRYIYHYENALDVVNDGFVKLFNTFERFETGSPESTEQILMGYIKRIMINTAIDFLRKRKMIPEIGGIPDHIWDVKDSHQDADQNLLYKDLIKIIKQLSPKYRSVFNLYVIDGYNHLEIADILNISVGTSKSCLSRARVMLQNSIKQIEEAVECKM